MFNLNVNVNVEDTGTGAGCPATGPIGMVDWWSVPTSSVPTWRLQRPHLIPYPIRTAHPNIPPTHPNPNNYKRRRAIPPSTLDEDTGHHRHEHNVCVSERPVHTALHKSSCPDNSHQAAEAASSAFRRSGRMSDHAIAAAASRCEEEHAIVPQDDAPPVEARSPRVDNVCRPMPAADEAKLLQAIHLEVQRDGGVAAANALKGYNRLIGKLLGDRRLVAFLRSHPEAFRVQSAGVEGSGSFHVRLVPGWTPPSQSPHDGAARKEMAPEAAKVRCSFCQRPFASRNRMFRHVREGIDGGASCHERAGLGPMPATTDHTPQVGAAKEAEATLQRVCCGAIRQRVERQRAKMGDGGCDSAAVQLVWLATHSKVKAALHGYLRLQPRPAAAGHAGQEGCAATLPYSPAWWTSALPGLEAFLRERPELFAVEAAGSNEAPASVVEKEMDTAASHTPVDVAQLKARLVRLATQTAHYSPDAPHGAGDTSAAAVCRRTIQLLSSGGHCGFATSLGELGSDALVKARLGGENLRATLEACGELDVFVGQRGDYMVKMAARENLRPNDSAASSGDPRAPASRTGHGATEVPVLHRGPGVLVLSKPAGLSTEQVVGEAWRRQRHLEPALVAGGQGDEHPCRTDAATPPSPPSASRPWQTVSRLDVLTSGVLVVPTSPAAFQHLKGEFGCRRVRKTYLALVHGRAPPEGIVDTRLRVVSSLATRKTFVHPRGKDAVTEYRRLRLYQPPGAVGKAAHAGPVQPGGGGEEEEMVSLLEVHPRTGRTHQIRAHLASIGHPLVRDSKYYSQRWQTVSSRHGDSRWCSRVFLHAARVRFAEPGGRVREVQAGLTKELLAILDALTPVPGGPGEDDVWRSVFGID